MRSRGKDVQNLLAASEQAAASFQGERERRRSKKSNWQGQLTNRTEAKSTELDNSYHS